MANKRINELTQVASVVATTELEVQTSGETTTKKATLTQVTAVEKAAREAQDDVIEASVGLSTAGAFAELANAWYLRAAEFTAGMIDRSGAVAPLTQNVINAIRLLDAKLYVTNTIIPTWIKTTTVIVPTVSILACNATPYVLIDGVAGYTHEIISIVASNNYGGVAFEAGTDKLEIKYDGGATMFEFPNAFIEATADTINRGVATANQVLIPEADIVMTCATAPTTGTSGFVFVITYRSHPVV